MWGRLSGKVFPDRLPDDAVAYLGAMECDLIDEEDMEETWLTTLVDEPSPGPVRDEIESLVPGSLKGNPAYELA
jgi:hypothetical protein